jgi:hypothetical protein
MRIWWKRPELMAPPVRLFLIVAFCRLEKLLKLLQKKGWSVGAVRIEKTILE